MINKNMQFSFGGLGVGLIFLISSLSYTISILIIGPIVERLASLIIS